MSEARIQLDAQVQVRRDIEANWAAVDPVLRDGEIAYSKDLNRIKVGDGARKWSELEYMAGSSASLSLDTEMSDTSENAVQNKVIKAYVDTKAKEAQAAAEQYIQNEVLTDYATTKYVGEREEYLVGYAEGLVSDLEKEINGRGYLTSAAMDSYATKEDIKDFVTKGNSFAHYGISNFDFGSAELKSNGNKFLQSFGGADTYVFATNTLYLEAPNIYVSAAGGSYRLVHAGNYKEVLTGVSLYSGSLSISDRLNYRHLGYGYTSGGWKTAGPALSFGLSTFQHYIQGEVYTNKLYHCAYNNGELTDWKLLIDEGNIGDYAAAKATTLAGYGITDAVIKGSNFDATSQKPWILGYSNTAYGWKVTGPAMIFGTYNYYARFNFAQGANDNPLLYMSLVHDGQEYGWAQVVTDKNFTQFGVKAGRRYTGAYDDDPKSANDIDYPSMAGFTAHLADVPFQNGNLLTITTNPNLYVGQIAIKYDGSIAARARSETTWTEWATMVTDKNIASYAISSNGGTINAGKYLKFGTNASLGVASTLDGYDKLVVSGLTQMSDLYITERLYFEKDCIITFRNWSTGKSESISSFSDLKTILGLGSLAYKDEAEVAKWSNNIIVSDNESFKHIGYANAGNGWASVGGPAMAFGSDKTQYVKLVFPNYNEYYQQRIYYKHIKGGVEATSWGEILTKDNFSAYGLALKTDTASWSPTDAGAYIGYTTGINSWATAGIAAALAYGNYTGLLNFAGGTDGNVGLFISNSHNGTMRAWEKVLTDKTLAKFASSNDLTTEGKWKIDITGMADKFGVEYTGNLDTNSRNGLAHYNTGTTGRPSNYGMVMQMANVSNPVPGTAEHWITQIASSTYNDLYYRIRINTGAWQEWRKILTDANIGATSLPSLNLNGETINSWADAGAMPTKSQTTTSGTVSIAPNVLNKWSNALTGTLTINFVSGTSGVANYYMIEFTTGANLPTINLPSGVKWENGFDVLSNLVANTTYQISILNNLAVGGAF